MTRAPIRSVPAYAVLASRYDEAYAEWRAYLSVARDEILRADGAPPGSLASVLDVGCASGWQSVELARRGARVVAVDPVARFLPPIRRLARREGLALDARRGDALHLSLRPRERFDLALATFDVLNHLERRASLRPAFRSIARALAPGGRFLFDLNTPETLESFEDHHRVTRLPDGSLSAETGRWDARRRVGTVERDWFLPGPRAAYRRLRERYDEIAWERPEVEEALREAGLAVVLFADAAGWMSFSPAGARWIVLARRAR